MFIGHAAVALKFGKREALMLGLLFTAWAMQMRTQLVSNSDGCTS